MSLRPIIVASPNGQLDVLPATTAENPISLQPGCSNRMYFTDSDGAKSGEKKARCGRPSSINLGTYYIILRRIFLFRCAYGVFGQSIEF